MCWESISLGTWSFNFLRFNFSSTWRLCKCGHLSSFALVVLSVKWWSWRKRSLRIIVSRSWFILTDENWLCFLNSVQGHHVGSLKLASGGVFTQWKLASGVNQGFPTHLLLKQVVKRLPLSERPSNVNSFWNYYFCSINQSFKERGDLTSETSKPYCLIYFSILFLWVSLMLSPSPPSLVLPFWSFPFFSALFFSDHVTKFRNKCICYSYTPGFGVFDCKMRLTCF